MVEEDTTNEARDVCLKKASCELKLLLSLEPCPSHAQLARLVEAASDTEGSVQTSSVHAYAESGPSARDSSQLSALLDCDSLKTAFCRPAKDAFHSVARVGQPRFKTKP